MKLVREDEMLAAFIRDAGELCEGAHRRALMTHVGNVTCIATMAGLYLLGDAASAAQGGMVMLSITSLPALAAEGVVRVRRWRRRRG